MSSAEMKNKLRIQTGIQIQKDHLNNYMWLFIYTYTVTQALNWCFIQAHTQKKIFFFWGGAAYKMNHCTGQNFGVIWGWHDLKESETDYALLINVHVCVFDRAEVWVMVICVRVYNVKGTVWWCLCTVPVGRTFSGFSNPAEAQFQGQ